MLAVGGRPSNVLVQLATEIHYVSDLEYWPGNCTVPPTREEIKIKTWETEYVHKKGIPIVTSWPTRF